MLKVDLAQAISRGLKAVSDQLSGLSHRTARLRLPWNLDPSGRETERVLALVRELEGLEGARRDGIARGLALLWEDFVENFGGLGAGDVERSHYLEKVRQIEEQLEANPQNRAYALAARAMTAYVSGLGKTEISIAESELSGAIVTLIDRGHRVAAARTLNRSKRASDRT